MWTAEDFGEILKERPAGGTFWTRSHRCVRYVRVLRPGKKTIVAVMTELSRLQKPLVVLYVKTEKGACVGKFKNATKDPKFLKRLLKASVLKAILDGKTREKVGKFIRTPDKSLLPTW